MRLTIDESILSKYNLNLNEFLVLYLCATETNIKDIIDNVISKKFADKDLKDSNNAVVSNNVKELLSAMIIDSDKAVIDKDDKYLSLAESLINLYPKGKKPGTNYYWRDSPAIIAKKLKTVVIKFKVNFTAEEAINATSRYVKSFENKDKTLMHLLKYFILKTDTKTGEIKSEFLSYLCNNEDEGHNSEDWTVDIR